MLNGPRRRAGGGADAGVRRSHDERGEAPTATPPGLIPPREAPGRRTLAGPLLLFALFGAFYVIPPQGSDRLVHLSGIVEARNALREGQFPPRVAPNLSEKTRYPLFQFYGALPYGVAGGVMLVTGLDAHDAWRVVTFLSVTCAGFYAYRCALLLTRQTWASIVAGAVFVTAPYLSTDFRARFAFTEAVSFCLLPAVLYYSLRAFAARGRGAVVKAGVSWALLALSHSITLLYGSILLGLFALTLLGPGAGKSMRRLARVAAAYALGMALAAWYVAPQLKVIDVLVMTTDNAGASPLGSTAWAPLYALLSPVLTVAPEAKNSPYLGVQVGWPILAAVVLALAHVVRAAAARRRPPAALRVPGAGMMARLLAALALAFFVVWSPVDFWRHVPRLLYNLQITYRLLMFVVLWGSLLAGMALAALWRRTPGGMPPGPAWACVLLCAVAAMPFQGWGFDRLSNRTVKALEKAPFFGQAEHQYNALPRRMAAHRLDVPPGVTMVASDDVAPRVRRGRVTRASFEFARRTVVQLPVRFYPGLIDVRDNGRRPDASGHVDGFLALDLPPGRHEIEVRFVGVRWANRLSALAWVGVGVCGAAAFATRIRAARAAGPAPAPAPRARPALPLRAAVFGAALLAVPMVLPAAAAHRKKANALRNAGRVLSSTQAFPGARAHNAFDGDRDTEWVTIPGPSAWLVIEPPSPRAVSTIELEPRQTEVLGGWHTVAVTLRHGGRVVSEQTFRLPDAARQPVQVLRLARPATADAIELRFADPVTLRRDGRGHTPPEFCYGGYREIRVK